MHAHETGRGGHASSQSARQEPRPLFNKLVTTLSRLVWPSRTTRRQDAATGSDKSKRTRPAVPSHWRPPTTGLRWATESHDDDLLCDEEEFAVAAAADVDTALGTSTWELVLAPESEELDRLTGSFYPSVRDMPARGPRRFERLRDRDAEA